MRLKLELDDDTAALLMRQAVRDLRTIDFEAEYLIREALKQLDAQAAEEVAAC